METNYWLNLLHDADYLASPMLESLFADVDELSNMLFTPLRSTNLVKRKQPPAC